jgi:flagellar protein FlgJ
VLAHAALETGWGRHLPRGHDGASSNNLFGIKAGASWTGDSVSVPTLEYDGDVARRAQSRFRAYASPEASFEDYATLIGGDPRYAEALARGDDIAGYARALQDGGYATDPSYARKLEELARGEQMKAALAGAPNDGARAPPAYGARARQPRAGQPLNLSSTGVSGLLGYQTALSTAWPQHLERRDGGYSRQRA